jgi:hypothetical protein
LAQPRPDLRRGRIVWAAVRDRKGARKERPVVILTATEDIHPDKSLEVMAVTTSFPDPPPADHVELPWHPRGIASTRLRRRSAAVLSWITEIRPAHILSFHGDVPPRLMTEILERLPYK